MSHDSHHPNLLDYRSRAVRAATGVAHEPHQSRTTQHIVPSMTNPNIHPAPHRDISAHSPAPVESQRRASRRGPGQDANTQDLSNHLVAKFIEQLTEGVAEQTFLPHQEYSDTFSDHNHLDLASFFWEQAGPSTRGNRACWSWRYLAGCALMLEGYPNDSRVKYSKQDRSEWRKVARFANTVIARTMPRIGKLAYVMLDTLAANSGLCRVLRKLPQYAASAEAMNTAAKLNLMTIPSVELTTNSMNVLVVLEDLTGASRDHIARKIGMTDLPSSERYNAQLILPPWMVGDTWQGDINASQAQVNAPNVQCTDQGVAEGVNALVPPHLQEKNDNTIFTPHATPSDAHWEALENDMGFQWRHWAYAEAHDVSSNTTSEFGNSPSSGASGGHNDYLREGYTEEWPQTWGLMPGP